MPRFAAGTPPPPRRNAGWRRLARCAARARTLREERRLAGLVLRHLVRRVLLALLAVRLLRLRNVHLRGTGGLSALRSPGCHGALRTRGGTAPGHSPKPWRHAKTRRAAATRPQRQATALRHAPFLLLAPPALKGARIREGVPPAKGTHLRAAAIRRSRSSRAQPQQWQPPWLASRRAAAALVSIQGCAADACAFTQAPVAALSARRAAAPSRAALCSARVRAAPRVARVVTVRCPHKGTASSARLHRLLCRRPRCDARRKCRAPDGIRRTAPPRGSGAARSGAKTRQKQRTRHV